MEISHDAKLMTDHSPEEAYIAQIMGLVEEFMQAQMMSETTLPKELARLRDRLDKTHFKEELHRGVKYSLFYRMSLNLYRKSNLTMGELSNTLLVPLSTATRMVDWLVETGYAQRLLDPEDRRIVRVALTDKGWELHKAIVSYIAQRFQQTLSCLTVEEQTTLFAIIRKVVAALKEMAR